MKMIKIVILMLLLVACSKENANYSLMLKYNKNNPITLFNYRVDVINVAKDDTSFTHIDTTLYQKIEQIYSNGDFKLLFGGKNLNDSNSVVIKTTPFGEILFSKNNSNLKDEFDDDRNIEKLLLKFYPMLPYKKVSIGETWNRSQVVHTEEKEFWGDIHLSKLFKLVSVQNDIAEIKMSIRSSSVLTKKLDENVKMDVDVIVDGTTFINSLKGEIIKMEIKSTVIKSTSEEKIFSQRDMKWVRQQQ